jgi:monofunctional biosynthetic peptidoglycan transglycosylase
MDKNNKVLLSIFLALTALVGGAMALILDAFVRIPDFTQMRSKIVVPIKLADKTWVDREMGPKTASWVGAKQISNPMFMAVIASEDTSFYSHQGIDFHELQESIKKDWEEKRWARGASTLTQQVVKNVFLSREKSLWRKFKEMVWAREIEKVLSKTEILTFYLNMAEWGPSLYGIKEASFHYFGISPSEISPKQAAFLAMLLPSPIKFHSYFVKKELTPYARSRVGKILRVMNRMGFIDEEQYSLALTEKLWGVTGELPAFKEGGVEPEEDSDEGLLLDVLKEPSPQKLQAPLQEEKTMDYSEPTQEESLAPDVFSEPNPEKNPNP